MRPSLAFYNTTDEIDRLATPSNTFCGGSELSKALLACSGITDACRMCVEGRIRGLGRQIGSGRGDSPNYTGGDQITPLSGS